MAVAVCRHGHILMMANCTGGEKHGYAILCLYLLLLAGLVVKVWWYDINCRYCRTHQPTIIPPIAMICLASACAQVYIPAMG